MPLHIEFPESLPVSAKREEIMAAIAAHQVVIVCGETGSGKTTQLPKIALAMGRGKCNAPEGTPPHLRRMIGHTQPRRIAASSVAKRIAEELKTPLGDVVGFKVRFQDRLSRDASVKLMTDGILLAETQTDPLLKAYDTLIIDEAHERSLNIDFLLGYLREILPRRPDLKVIVTSATIDADRFAKHFESKSGPAPVIMVSGRTFPVEQRYRPFEESRDYDLNSAIADGVDELWRDPHNAGDILIFLPGEREIREAADHLRKHLAHQPLYRSAEVLPLFARLSQTEQDRIFDSHGGRRIVLATNVAETSLTVPGIRYVIDPGTARLKRYSFRSKVEQLLVEPVSQSSANQRAGRCGRVANGICIRLYDEADFNSRPRFTDPEILRSSLAGVILRMKGLRLGDVERFPFLEAPRPKAIADGYQLLAELGAVDEANELTRIGHELSKLPLDPRVGRMILEARERGALEEVLVIAAALSVQDVRDRPMEAQQQADQAHAKFDDEKSEFSGYLNLWKWLGDHKGGHGDQKLSNRQYESLLRQNFISVRRLREWRDIHSQLLTVVAEHKWRVNVLPASYESLHLSMLAGMLGNVGYKLEDEAVYLGARGIKFYSHPGAHLKKKPGRWIVCAELVETTRLFGRGIAAIEPQWIEQVAGHLLKKQLLDPHWEKKTAEVTALERATLYGIVIYSGRRVNFGQIDPVGAREVFIREALVNGDWDTKLPFLAANQKLITQVEDLEHKSRRQDVLVDDELIYAFYDAKVPADVCSGAGLEAWLKGLQREGRAGSPHPNPLPGREGSNPQTNPQTNPSFNLLLNPLLLTRDELMRHEAAGITAQTFPRILRLGGVDCKTTYLHEPGDPKDGMTVELPLFALNQVNDEQCEWLVPGMLKEKILALLKSLHQKPRSRFVPLPDAAERLTALFTASPPSQGLTDALLRQVRLETSLDVKRNDFKLEMLKPHLFMNFRVVDEHGRQMGTGRNLAALKADLGGQARGAFQALAALKVANLASNTEIALDTRASVAIKNEVIAGRGGAGSPHPNPPVAQLSQAGEGTRPAVPPTTVTTTRYTTWTFGELPELMEVSTGRHSMIGFPALIDQGDAVTIEVFDEPEVAAARHRLGLARLFALHIKDALKYLEKNIPDLQAMGVQYMQVGRNADGSGGGTVEELRGQIIAVALDRAFLAEPLPSNEYDFKRRIDDGRQRLTLIANEVARLCATILAEFAVAQRKIKDNKNYPPAADAVADATQQLQRLVPKRFMPQTAWSALQHCPRYLKAITLRLDKLRADPARDSSRLTELRPIEQRFWRLVAERKGVQDARLQEFRWLLEELRVSFFAQELRTPQPVSVKRLEKAWGQLQG